TFSFTPQFLSSWTSTRNCAVFSKPAATAWIGRTTSSRASSKPSTGSNASHEHPRFARRQRLAQRLKRDFFNRRIYFHPSQTHFGAQALHDFSIYHLVRFSRLLSDLSHLPWRRFASRADAISESVVV